MRSSLTSMGYDEDGMTVAKFDGYGRPCAPCAFIQSYHDLVGLIRDFMLPNPDVSSSTGISCNQTCCVKRSELRSVSPASHSLFSYSRR
jgi:hypothetical protein